MFSNIKKHPMAFRHKYISNSKEIGSHKPNLSIMLVLKETISLKIPIVKSK